jgi:hypothetical protein
MLRVVTMSGIGSALNYQAGGFGSPAAAFWSGTQKYWPGDSRAAAVPQAARPGRQRNSPDTGNAPGTARPDAASGPENPLSAYDPDTVRPRTDRR